MAGSDIDARQFTGIQRYFNSYTLIGRRNCVLLTYGTLLTIFMYFKLRPSKQKALPE
uniref:Up-regulated during skeletal muscle growth protein 5 n=1 Tax=Eptatretus burgeri TaxID=7764 RepID=A0A8C4NGR8_EPTBU